MVVYEAASAIVNLPSCTAKELAPAVSGNPLTSHWFNGWAQGGGLLVCFALPIKSPVFGSVAVVLQFPQSRPSLCSSSNSQQGKEHQEFCDRLVCLLVCLTG